ncbi:C2H2 type zinc finger domain protein [Stagonosporopsis vannaccii]|nr:C2H2 type zinc finger domain protein [Stagonosporopsis vannaccii]
MLQDSLNRSTDYQCPHCQRNFARLEHLQRHIRTREFNDTNSRQTTLTASLQTPRKSHSYVPAVAHLPAKISLSATGSETTTRLTATPTHLATQSKRLRFHAAMQLPELQALPHCMMTAPQPLQSQQTFPDVFDEFTSFIEFAGLDCSWEDYQYYATAPLPETSATAASVEVPRRGEVIEVDDDSFVGLNVSHRRRSSVFNWCVTEADRQTLERKTQAALAPSSSPLRMPTRNALTRYFHSYAEMFQKHFPLLHLATYSIDERSPALSLAVAAIGSQYRYEFAHGVELYRVAREMTMHRIMQCPNRSSLLHSDDASSTSCGDLDHIATTILLIAYAQWMSRAELLPEALELQGPLAHAMRQGGLREPTEMSVPNDWREWLAAESQRRAKLVGFVFLNVQTVIYNVPAQVLTTEIDLLLPCSSMEWAASNAESWIELQHSPMPRLSFQEGLSNLMLDQIDSARHQPGTSPFALFVLLQGLLQKVVLARQLQPCGESILRPNNLDMLESALQLWKSAWRCDPGATLDPQNIDGALPFTSVAFLALTYVRLFCNLGPYRRLESRDPITIAATLTQVYLPPRTPRMVSALLLATHAMSLPVRMGIPYVSRNQMYFWSCQHCACALECAVFVWKWLQQVDAGSGQDVSDSEARVISWIRDLVKESWPYLDLDELGLQQTNIEDLSLSHLGAVVLFVWSHVFAHNTMWPLIQSISKALRILAKQAASEIASQIG